MTPEWRALIHDAVRFTLAAPDPALVAAVVWQESNGDPWAYNPEPAYRYLWDVKRRRPFRRPTPAELRAKTPPADFQTLAGDPDQEWWAQQASWGLMQVMGAVARERGLRAPYLSILCDPVLNLREGTAILASLIHWSGGEISQALAAYNGGRGGWRAAKPQAYAQAVLTKWTRVQRGDAPAWYA